MSRGLGSRQREILAKLAAHRDNPPDYNGYWQHHKCVGTDRSVTPHRFIYEPLKRPRYHEKPKWMHDRHPEWMTVRELAGLRPNDLHCHASSDVEATRRAVRKLEIAGLVDTKMIWRNQRGQRQLAARLT